MKTTLCLNQDIHCATALNYLLPYLKQHQISIILSHKVGCVDNLPLALQQLQQCEKGDLLSLFAKIDRGENATFRKPRMKTFKEIAGILNSQIAFYDDINGEASLAAFKTFGPDVVISIRFGHIFKAPIIAIPKHGILNLHSGILPHFRGIMSSFWAVLQGQLQLGTTLHYIEDYGIDTGSIVGCARVHLDTKRSLVFNINALYKSGCALLIEHVDKISKGLDFELLKQKDLTQGQYFSYPKAEDIQRFLDIMPLITDEDRLAILRRWQ